MEAVALQRLKTGGRQIVYYYGIHTAYFPLAISISIKGNIVPLNCFQTLIENSMKGSVLTAQLYGAYIDISMNVMLRQYHDYDL